MEYYSQHREEDIILKYFPDALTIPGRYVDIGGGWVTELSNTYLLYQHGWQGLVVEPYDVMYQGHVKYRPKDINLKLAISNYIGESEHLDTATIGSPIGNIYKNVDMMLRRDTGQPYDHYVVNCITMNRLIADFPEFAEPDFISIDIDTNEEKLLECCDFSKFKPKLIVIEYMVRDVDYRPRWEHFLAPFYVSREMVPGNIFYWRRDLPLPE